MRSLILAVTLAALAAPAFADTQWTATPVQPVTKAGIVAGSVIWNCDASACHPTSDTADADQLASCRNMAKEVGELSSFVTSDGPFSAARLSHCNAAAASKQKP